MANINMANLGAYPQSQVAEAYGNQGVAGTPTDANGLNFVQNNPRGPVKLRGYQHMFDIYTLFKWKFPNFYRNPGLGYQKLAQYRHVDWFNREWTGDMDDRYISSTDGKVKRLIVQAVDDIYDNDTNSTWRRTFIRNMAPLYLRLANWPFNHVDYLRSGGPTADDWLLICAKWFLASVAITFVIGVPSGSNAEVRHEGKYDPFPYKYIGYPKVSRNAFEMDRQPGRRIGETNPVIERLLRPRYLCFIQAHGESALVTDVEQWIRQSEGGEDPSYVFVAYTAEQFRSTQDLIALHQMADAAARRAGVPAYWIGCSCMPDPATLQDDVYRICDVIRGAQSLAIVVGHPQNGQNNVATRDQMLQQWGRRVWTFPEVLLSPAGKAITVYTRGMDQMRPLEIAKNQFAAQVWPADAHTTSQLVDHYENNLVLSQLELVTLSLECLHKRETTQYLPGDHSYALMGLLRIRPQIDPTDSAFQAFARLSLANGSDQLLERLICVLPKFPDQPWHSMDDAFDSKLWDILPGGTSVSGVGADDTVILDGCYAASIRWKSFAPVAYTQRATWKKQLAKGLLRIGGVVFWLSVILLGFELTRKKVGVPLFIYSIILMGPSPYLLRVLYLGKFWSQQGWFFGFEGYMDIETIERQIFGARLGRMKWTPYSSPLSRHHRNEYDECVADDPTSDPVVAALVQQSKRAVPGQQRIFTIVDTGNMTATLIWAARPPVCFIFAGSEGGMQRAIGCSYDWTTATLYRETVVRFVTPIVDNVFRVDRLKIGFKRRQQPYGPVAQVGEPFGKLRR